MANTLQEKYAERIEHHLSKYPDKRSAVMPLLYIAMEEYGWLNEDAIGDVAEICDMDPTQVRSIAGFYTMFRESPKGKIWLHVCTDLPCALRGAEEFYDELLKELGIKDGETTKDEMFTCDHVMCLGACHRAPMLQANFRFHENLDMDKMRALIAEWRKNPEQALVPTK